MKIDKATRRRDTYNDLIFRKVPHQVVFAERDCDHLDGLVRLDLHSANVCGNGCSSHEDWE